jgi:hypothetical protein
MAIQAKPELRCPAYLENAKSVIILVQMHRTRLHMISFLAGLPWTKAARPRLGADPKLARAAKASERLPK